MHASKKQTYELATRSEWRWNARWGKEDEGQGQVVGSRACTVVVVVVGWIGVVESSSNNRVHVPRRLEQASSRERERCPRLAPTTPDYRDLLGRCIK